MFPAFFGSLNNLNNLNNHTYIHISIFHNFFILLSFTYFLAAFGSDPDCIHDKKQHALLFIISKCAFLKNHAEIPVAFEGRKKLYMQGICSEGISVANDLKAWAAYWIKYTLIALKCLYGLI